MKHLRTILLFLLIGAVVNVALAWGCAMWAGLGKNYDFPLDDTPILEAAHVSAGLDPEVWQRGVFGLKEYTIMWHVPGESNAIWLYRAGWPMAAMQGAVDNDGKRRSIFYVRAPVAASGLGGGFRTMPLMPVWKGFVLNTLVFGAGVWLLVAEAVDVRRRRYKQKGRCVRCGYDLRGSPPDHEACPECGEAA